MLVDHLYFGLEVALGLPDLPPPPARPTRSGEPAFLPVVREALSWHDPTLDGAEGRKTWRGLCLAVLEAPLIDADGATIEADDPRRGQLVVDWSSGALWSERTGEDFTPHTYRGEIHIANELSAGYHPERVDKPTTLGSIFGLAECAGWCGQVAADNRIRGDETIEGLRKKAEDDARKRSPNPFIRMALIGDEIDDVQEVPFSIEGMYPEGGVGFIYGHKGTLKTTSELHRLKCRQYELPYAGVPTKPGNCILFAGEAPDVVQMAHRAWMERYARDLEPKGYFMVVPKVPDFGNEQSVKDLVAFLEWLPDKPDEIVFDHLFRACGGDPSKVEVMKPYVECLEALRDTYRAYVSTIAHMPRNGVGVFGSVASEAYADVLWHAKLAKRGGPVELWNEKQKAIGEREKPVCFGRAPVIIPDASRPGLVLEHATRRAYTPATQATDVRIRHMVDTLREYPHSVHSSKALANEVAKRFAGDQPGTIQNLLTEIVKAGQKARDRKAVLTQREGELARLYGWFFVGEGGASSGHSWQWNPAARGEPGRPMLLVNNASGDDE